MSDEERIYPSDAELSNMVRAGLDPNTPCEFVSLNKGEYTYKFKHDGKWLYVTGGNASYEDAYYLSLSNPEPLHWFYKYVDNVCGYCNAEFVPTEKQYLLCPKCRPQTKA